MCVRQNFMHLRLGEGEGVKKVYPLFKTVAPPLRFTDHSSKLVRFIGDRSYLPMMLEEYV
jgi:hypothetical protein